MPDGQHRVRVTRAHTASHPDPIRLRRGDNVTLGRRDTTWPAYVWCTGPDGREGWVPEAYLDVRERSATADRDYDARELAVAPGDELDVLDEAGGWWLCRRPDGAIGWVPQENTEAI